MSNTMAISRLAIWAAAQAGEPNDEKFIVLLEEILEQGRAEMRVLMACGHPKACLVVEDCECEGTKESHPVCHIRCSVCEEIARKVQEQIDELMAAGGEAAEILSTARWLSPEELERRVRLAKLAAIDVCRPWLRHSDDCAYPILPSNDCTCGLLRSLDPDEIGVKQ